MNVRSVGALINTLVLSLLISGCSKSTEKMDEVITEALVGKVEILNDAVHLTKTNRTRTLRVYLPPSYNEESNKQYAVLYMHDAQNLFDDKTSFVGEWGIDESMDELATSKNFELIVVGIDNHPEFRINEYSAWSHEKYGAGDAEAFIDDIVNVVKPYIDNKYRTKPERASTAMMGSSLGGLATHYAVIKHSDTFSKAGVFSPSYWYAPQSYQFTQDGNLAFDSKWYFLVGGKEGEGMVSNMNKMIDQMLHQGMPENNIESKVLPDAEHNEKFWRSEFSNAVLWLFNENS